ncbi:unnamed protein product [Linum trigynum]|uniref:Uncharacterized protein n=1 Tax=Linum trigynum TaxID=586398 RepID=A0AAV2DVM5_9ROSI
MPARVEEDPQYFNSVDCGLIYCFDLVVGRGKLTVTLEINKKASPDGLLLAIASTKGTLNRISHTWMALGYKRYEEESIELKFMILLESQV